MRPDEQQEPGSVTGRQLEVLCLLAVGLTSSEAAERLGISEHTVIRHVTNMGMSVGAENRLELLALAIIGGLIDPNHWPPKPTGRLRLQILQPGLRMASG
jgi:DNA-binding CsgD family transcriptional regulator